MFYIPDPIDVAAEKKRLKEEEEKRRKEGYTSHHVCVHCKCEYSVFHYDPHLLNSDVEKFCIICRMTPAGK